MASPSRSVAVLSLAIAAALLSYDPLAQAATPKRTALALVAMGCAAAVTSRANAKDDREGQATPAAITAWWALCAWMAASMLWAAQPQWTSVALWLTAGVVGWFVAQLDDSGRRTVAMVVGLVVAIGASATLLVQWLLGARGMQLHAGFGNPNWLGISIVVALPFAMEAAGALRQWLRQLARGVWLTVALLALVLSRSGSALVALAVLALFTVAGSWPAEHHKNPTPSPALPTPSRWPHRILAAATFAALGAVALIPAWRSGVSHSMMGRLWIWRHSGAAALDALPFGVGAGGFAKAFGTEQGHVLQKYPIEEASRLFVNATSAHNDWLQLLVEGGLPAPLLLTMVLVLGFIWTRKEDAPSRATLIAVAVVSLGDMALQLPVVAVLLLLALARGRPLPKPRRRRLPRRAAALSMMLLAGLITALSARRWLVERAMAAPLVLEQRLARLDWCSRVDPSYGEAALAHGLALLTAGEPGRARRSLLRSRERLHNIGTELALGNSWMREGRAELAIRAYGRALILQPGSFRGHLNMTAAQLAAGDVTKAEQHLGLAAELQPFHPKLRRLAEQLRRAQADAATD